MISRAILKATLEESADKKQEVIFVAAGFVAAEKFWDKFERAWRTQLDESKIKYYKTSDWRNLNGQFTGINRQSADHTRAELEKLIFANRIMAFTLGVIMRDYGKVRSESPTAKLFYEDDPAVTAFYHLMDAMNRTVRKKAKGCSIAFVYDDSSKSQRILHAFDSLKKVHPFVAKTLTTFLPLSDKEQPALQATDLLADVAKNMYCDWLARGRPRYVPIPQGWKNNLDFTGKMDEAYLLHEMSRTLASSRFQKGLLPVRPVSRNQRRREKRRREHGLA